MRKVHVDFGRPKNKDAERQFKHHLAINSTRIELECESLYVLYERFFQADAECIFQQNLFELFLKHEGDRLWAVLFDASTFPGQFPPKSNQRFTSQLDVRYLAHLVRREGVQAMTPNQLLLFLAAYLMKIRMLNVSLFQFIQEVLTSGQFDKIVLEGPNALATSPSTAILKLLAHWGLCLLQMEDIKIIRRASPQPEPISDTSCFAQCEQQEESIAL